MIDRGDIRQAIDRCSNIWAYCRALVMVSSSIRRRRSCEIQRSGRNGQRDWCMSRVTAIISALVICIIVCLSWAVNHYRDNAITYKSPARQKCQRTEAGERGNYWHADASAWCCCARCKIHEELADAKAENDLRDDVAAGRRRLHIEAVCQSVREATASGVDVWPSPTGRHRWTGLFHPPGWSLCKNNWKNSRSILMSSADECPYRWAAPYNYCEQYTRASSEL